MAAILSLRSGGEESDKSGSKRHGSNVVDGGAEASEDVEGNEDEESEKHRVVEEDRKSCRLVLGNLRNIFMHHFVHLIFKWSVTPLSPDKGTPRQQVDYELALPHN